MPQLSDDELLAVARQVMERPDKLSDDINTLLSTGGALLYILNQLIGVYDEKTEMVAVKSDLTTEDGVRRALKSQGELTGLNLAIQIIISLRERKEPKE